jgi:hypothetical protein
VFARPSFHEDGLIHAFRMEIVWDRDVSVLLVREVAAGKNLPLQFGKVYIPRASMHLFILSNEKGWLKKVIFTQIDVYKRMKGIMLTMGHAFANVYAPVAVPAIMNKYERSTPAWSERSTRARACMRNTIRTCWRWSRASTPSGSA